MKKIILILSILLFAFTLFADKRNRDENIRFGMPGHDGIVMTKPGFVLMVDKKRKVPLWTSYKLTKKDFEKNIKYKKMFDKDPKLQKGKRAVNSDYTIQKRYDRARMVDSKAMLRSKEALQHSQYLSNVCPMEGMLNRGKWRELEKKVRDFVETNKTVWIYAGAVFADTNGDGKKNDKGKIGKHNIGVPTHFYKMILYQGRDYSFHAITFLFKNTNLIKDLSAYTTTVDKVEEMTGMDFYHLLHDNVETIIESRKPSKSEISYFLGK